MPLQSLSIEPLDTNVIELLNIALDVNANMAPQTLGVLGLPGGDAGWYRGMTKAPGRGPVVSVVRAQGSRALDSKVDRSIHSAGDISAMDTES